MQPLVLSAGQDGLGAAWADSRPNWEAPATFLPTLPLLESLSQCDFSGLSFSGPPPSLLPCEPPLPKGKDRVSLIFVPWCAAHWGLWQH